MDSNSMLILALVVILVISAVVNTKRRINGEDEMQDDSLNIP